MHFSHTKKTKTKKFRRCRGSNPGHPRDRREYSPLYYNELIVYWIIMEYTTTERLRPPVIRTGNAPLLWRTEWHGGGGDSARPPMPASARVCRLKNSILPRRRSQQANEAKRPARRARARMAEACCGTERSPSRRAVAVNAAQRRWGRAGTQAAASPGSHVLSAH
jgi:hypothetical protein